MFPISSVLSDLFFCQFDQIHTIFKQQFTISNFIISLFHHKIFLHLLFVPFCPCYAPSSLWLRSCSIFLPRLCRFPLRLTPIRLPLRPSTPPLPCPSVRPLWPRSSTPLVTQSLTALTEFSFNSISHFFSILFIILYNSAKLNRIKCFRKFEINFFFVTT
jgi:hypothetical protein